MNYNYKKLPDINKLNELFYYDSNTGNLHWKVNKRNHIKAGDIAGSIKNDCRIGYRRVEIDRTKYYVHRIIFKMANPDWDESGVIDHKNNIDIADNSIENLRISDKRKNAHNRRKNRNSSSQYKGVTWRKDCNKWTVHITNLNGKTISLGVYTDEIEAAKIYDTHATKLFGEHARINFP